MYKNFNYFILIFVLILRQGSGIISALHLSLFLSHLFLTFSFSLSSSLHFFHEAIIAEHTFVRDPFIVGWLAGWLPPQTCKKAASSLTLSHTQTFFSLPLYILHFLSRKSVEDSHLSLSLSRSLTQTDRRHRYRKTFFAITLVENHVLRVVGSNPTTAYWMDEFLHTGWTIFRMYLVLKIVITLFEKTKIKENRLGETISSAVKLRLDFDASFEAQNWHHQVEKLRFLHK